MSRTWKIILGLTLSFSVVLNIWLWTEKQSVNFVKDSWKKTAETKHLAWYLINKDIFFSMRIERAIAVLHAHNACYQPWEEYPDTGNALLGMVKVWDDIQMEHSSILYNTGSKNPKELKDMREYKYNEKIMPMAESIVKSVCPKKVKEVYWLKEVVLLYLETMDTRK